MLSAQTHGETHRQNDILLAERPKDTNPYPGRDPYRGETHIAPPFVDSSIWVSPWVWVRVFGTLGQRCVVLPMGFSLGLSTEQSAMCPLSYGCPPGYEPRTIELPLGANHFLNWLLNSFLNKLLGWGWGLFFSALISKTQNR